MPFKPKGTYPKAETARKYREQYGDKMPTSALAEKMYNENKALFKDKDAARYSLRYIEGKAGKRNKEFVKNDKFFKEEKRSTCPYTIPAPDSEELLPMVLPTSFNNFIFASDFHIPNHRIEPIEAMIKYAKENNINQLMIGGDLLDNTPFTRWQHEPINPHDVPRWFDMAKEFLRYLKSNFDTIYFIEGNHDFWYKRYLMQKAEMLFHDPYFNLEERLSLNEIGIRFIDQRYLVKAGKLNIHHGHFTFRGGGGYANAARMLYMKTKASMLCGHVHVESSHTEPDIDDSISTTFTVGCMCTLRPEYQPFGGKACHGFAHITVKPNKNFSVKNFRIYKGQIL
jgi:predicted phosphodiesterase